MVTILKFDYSGNLGHKQQDYREIVHQFIDLSEPETQRQATLHACLPRFLGDGD
jgi:hypothetical protein